jgi:L-threonylcarbamoyladenylate synthase
VNQEIYFSKENFPIIKKLLLDGKILVLLTDTIWGFSAHTENTKAISKIQSLKKRPENKPFLLLTDDISKICELNDFEQNFIKNNTPIECTFLLNRKKDKLKDYFPNHNKLAARIPNKPDLLGLLRHLSFPISSSSVNISGQNFLNTYAEIRENFNDPDVYFIKESDPKNQISSSIVEFENNQVKIIRQGAGLDKIKNL